MSAVADDHQARDNVFATDADTDSAVEKMQVHLRGSETHCFISAQTQQCVHKYKLIEIVSWHVSKLFPCFGVFEMLS